MENTIDDTESVQSSEIIEKLLKDGAIELIKKIDNKDMNIDYDMILGLPATHYSY